MAMAKVEDASRGARVRTLMFLGRREDATTKNLRLLWYGSIPLPRSANLHLLSEHRSLLRHTV